MTPEFSPEALQLAERPPAPLPRCVLRVLFALFIAAGAWTWAGRLDVIAVAQGKIVPQSYLQIVQPADSGILRELLVAEGAQVKAGQVLARFDARIAEADRRQIRNELQIRGLQLRRIDAELSGEPMRRSADDSAQLYAQVETQYRARRQAHLDGLEAERGIIAKAEQDLRSALEIETKLNKTLPIFKQQERAFDQLTRDGYAGRLMLLDKQRDRIEKEQDLAAQQYNIASLRAVVSQGQKRIAQIDSNYRQALQNERVEAEAQRHRLQQEWDKHAHRHALLELKAPQDGTVKDLATRTIGSVVSAGTVLMTVVPNEPLQAEVWITNQDAGFVLAGQRVKLKFAAYPFQRFGLLEGELVHLSPDASELPQAANLEKRRGELEHVLPQTGYRALVALSSDALEADGGRHRLTAGMQVTAEIHLGTRRVLEYLFSPLRKVAHEAARER
ncbi:MAG: HlyD family type I secretion periplasmic adaptor subunit [Betaproteobacteria bacterium]|nr:HlyD family type I secretion periplasmic adaptor subunit [Betaproteobacteria bacterium]